MKEKSQHKNLPYHTPYETLSKLIVQAIEDEQFFERNKLIPKVKAILNGFKANVNATKYNSIESPSESAKRLRAIEEAVFEKNYWKRKVATLLGDKVEGYYHELEELLSKKGFKINSVPNDPVSDTTGDAQSGEAKFTEKKKSLLEKIEEDKKADFEKTYNEAADHWKGEAEHWHSEAERMAEIIRGMEAKLHNFLNLNNLIKQKEIMETEVKSGSQQVLTVELLESLGFKHLPHFTIGGTMLRHIGRSRFLSISCAGTPNEMLCIQEITDSKSVENLIVIHNYDYDGKLSFQKLQKIVTLFNQGETPERSVATTDATVDAASNQKEKSDLKERFFKECTVDTGRFYFHNLKPVLEFNEDFKDPESVWQFFEPHIKG